MSVFLRRLSNPFALWTPSSSNHRSDDLSPQTKDIVFEWQLGSAEFCRIDADTLLRAEICSSSSHAKRVLQSAHKIGVVDPVSGRPNTSKIDSGIVKAIATISVLKQRELVMLIFFWEEEIARWESFRSEENELERRLEESELSAALRSELECLLEAARARKRLLPSVRDTYGQGDQLPAYSEHVP